MSSRKEFHSTLFQVVLTTCMWRNTTTCQKGFRKSKSHHKLASKCDTIYSEQTPQRTQLYLQMTKSSLHLHVRLRKTSMSLNSITIIAPFPLMPIHKFLHIVSRHSCPHFSFTSSFGTNQNWAHLTQCERHICTK